MQNDKRLSGRTVAILVANGFHEEDMTETQKALAADGAIPRVVSSEVGLVNGWHEGTWGHNFYVEVKPKDVLPSQYDALLLPGGDRGVKTLLDNAHARRIVKGMMDAGKPVAVVSDAVQLLIGTEAIAGRTVTARPELREAIEAVGGIWSDSPVVSDGTLITTGGGEALPEFTTTFLDAIERAGEGAREAA
ncbi:MAG: DJ-1/PfpI family protein [Alphaproteobacteria bacterium]